jgi:hypothetical protein
MEEERIERSELSRSLNQAATLERDEFDELLATDPSLREEVSLLSRKYKVCSCLATPNLSYLGPQTTSGNVAGTCFPLTHPLYRLSDAKDGY